MDEKKYSQLYQALLQEVLQFHSGNQRRIRKGMLSLLLVPLAFLVLLFLSDGSRVIFLLLWIVSMFGIAAYLIAVEYVDYEMQNKVKKITQKEVELDQLMALPTGMPQLLPHLRGRSQESEAAPEEPAPEEECPARSGEPEEKAVPVPGPEAAQPQDGGAFARLFNDAAGMRITMHPPGRLAPRSRRSLSRRRRCRLRRYRLQKRLPRRSLVPPLSRLVPSLSRPVPPLSRYSRSPCTRSWP